MSTIHYPGRARGTQFEPPSVARGRVGFDPATIAGEFALAVHDGNATSVVAPLYRRLSAAAPRARSHLTTVDPETLVGDLGSGAIDAAWVAPTMDLSSLECENLPPLLEMVAAIRRDHPRIGKRLSLDEFCSVPHATVSFGGTQSSSYVDELLESSDMLGASPLSRRSGSFTTSYEHPPRTRRRSARGPSRGWSGGTPCLEQLAVGPGGSWRVLRVGPSRGLATPYPVNPSQKSISGH